MVEPVTVHPTQDGHLGRVADSERDGANGVASVIHSSPRAGAAVVARRVSDG